MGLLSPGNEFFWLYYTVSENSVTNHFVFSRDKEIIDLSKHLHVMAIYIGAPPPLYLYSWGTGSYSHVLNAACMMPKNSRSFSLCFKYNPQGNSIFVSEHVANGCCSLWNKTLFTNISPKWFLVIPSVKHFQYSLNTVRAWTVLNICQLDVSEMGEMRIIIIRILSWQNYSMQWQQTTLLERSALWFMRQLYTRLNTLAIACKT